MTQFNDVKIVLMGDSITQGWPFADPTFFEGRSFVNRGIGGQTTPQMKMRFERDVIDARPKLVAILAGTNDIAGNSGPMTLQMTMDNLKGMVQLAREHRIGVILCSVFPAADYPWNPGVQPADKIVSLNQMIKEFADANDIVYADYYAATVDDEKGLRREFSGDGVHPNKKGYRAMEPVLEQAILESLHVK